MNVQNILTAVFYAVTISFLLAVIYCEVTKSSVTVVQQMSTDLYQEQIDLNTILKEHPISQEEISYEPIILPPVIQEKSIEITEPKMLTLVRKKELDLTNMNVTELREECGKLRIKWRGAVTDIKTGKKRSLRKAEMVAALQQKLSA